MNPPNLNQITRTPFVSTKDGVITREAYYFLLALVGFIGGNGNLSLNDIAILEAFDAKDESGNVRAKIDEIQTIVATIPDSTAQVAELRKLVLDVQTSLAMSGELNAQIGEASKALQDVRVLLASLDERFVLPALNSVSVLGIIRGAGVPTDGVTGANVATPGLIDYLDTTANDRYMNAGTLAVPTWKLWTRSP